MTRLPYICFFFFFFFFNSYKAASVLLGDYMKINLNYDDLELQQNVSYCFNIDYGVDRTVIYIFSQRIPERG